MYALLVQIIDKEPLDIMKTTAQGAGLEVWRRLRRRYGQQTVWRAIRSSYDKVKDEIEFPMEKFLTMDVDAYRNNDILEDKNGEAGDGKSKTPDRRWSRRKRQPCGNCGKPGHSSENC